MINFNINDRVKLIEQVIDFDGNEKELIGSILIISNETGYDDGVMYAILLDELLSDDYLEGLDVCCPSDIEHLTPEIIDELLDDFDGAFNIKYDQKILNYIGRDVLLWLIPDEIELLGFGGPDIKEDDRGGLRFI